MSVWSWKRSGWVNCILALSLILAVATGISSAGIRTGFRSITPSFRFYGRFYPEIGIFSMLLYISTLFGFINVILRYAYILDQNQIIPKSIDYLNKISVAVGIISFLGLFLIASFPVPLNEKDSSIQSAGAYIFIGFGFLFVILQTVLTFASIRCAITFSIRIFLAASLLSTFLSTLVLIENSKGESPSANFTTNPSTESEAIFYSKDDNQSQLIASGLEWTSVIIYALFYLTFFREFQKISAYIILRPFITPASNDFHGSSLTVNERV